MNLIEGCMVCYRMSAPGMLGFGQTHMILENLRARLVGPQRADVPLCRQRLLRWHPSIEFLQSGPHLAAPETAQELEVADGATPAEARMQEEEEDAAHSQPSPGQPRRQLLQPQPLSQPPANSSAQQQPSDDILPGCGSMARATTNNETREIASLPAKVFGCSVPPRAQRNRIAGTTELNC